MMIKNPAIAFLMIFSLLLFVGCAKTQFQPEEQVKAPETPSLPTAGEAPVDEVAAGISGINSAENELDTSGLEDLDDVLADIENI
ncbi:hypothetical protein HYU09_02855 [Candidatus Woesearchaeota archaeon]|nr:hypothetical protein [Candidatus Woesearchaeota archaeon]